MSSRHDVYIHTYIHIYVHIHIYMYIYVYIYITAIIVKIGCGAGHFWELAVKELRSLCCHVQTETDITLAALT